MYKTWKHIINHKVTSITTHQNVFTKTMNFDTIGIMVLT